MWEGWCASSHGLRLVGICSPACFWQFWPSQVDPLGLGQMACWVRVSRASEVPRDPWLRSGVQEDHKYSTGGARRAGGALGAQGGEPAREGLCKEMTKGRKEWTRAALGR